MLTSSQLLPATPQPCVNLCYESLEQMKHVVSKSKKFGSSDVENPLNMFVHSVKLLRGIVMEYECLLD